MRPGATARVSLRHPPIYRISFLSAKWSTFIEYFKLLFKPFSISQGLELSRVDKTSIDYVAFYSSVEHEVTVTVVESGYRVSLTYSLYVTESSQQAEILNVPSKSVKYSFPKEVSGFENRGKSGKSTQGIASSFSIH